MTRSFWILALLAVPALAVEPEVVGRSGKAVLYRYGDQRVLVVRGTPRAMGHAHGRLLKAEIAQTTGAFLEWAISKGRTREELLGIWKRLAPHIPAHFHEEMEGLAKGSGVALETLQLLHAIPSRHHCTGSAALPAVTKDHKLYHTRSLDFPLDIGKTVRPQTNSLLLVSIPDKGIAHAIVGWAGFLGCVTGMNMEGVSIGEMGSRSSDESFDGMPMIFLVREALRTARNLDEAKQAWVKHPRTCGFNFIVCDPKSACAIECNRSRVVFFSPGDKREDRAPHHAIPGVVRRCNHFVDPYLASTQRKLYDPRLGGAAPSFGAYSLQGRVLQENRGTIDLDTMISILRAYPPFVPCLHQAVMIPTDRVLWISQAVDPAQHKPAGAQNQAFYRYDLRAFVGGKAPHVERRGPTRGRVTTERRIVGVFGHEPQPFSWELEPLRAIGSVTVSHLVFPSPGPSLHPSNETVHAEYYRPKGKRGPYPAVIVLHILDGRFFVARMLATTLTQSGTAALFIQLPYYGKRRPADGVDMGKLDLPDLVAAIRQSVRDVRRGAAWLRARPEVDGARVGIAGVSLGSFMAQLAAGADGRFHRCAFVLGGGSLTDTIYSGSRDTRKIERLLAARGWTRPATRARLAPFEPLAWAGGVTTQGVLMINGDQDEVVPPASTRAYWEAVGKPEIVWYPGGHYGAIKRLPEILRRVREHFSR